MFTTAPHEFPTQQKTPPDVAQFLSENHWAAMSTGIREIWFKPIKTGTTGWMTWEQALTYQMWQRLTLGVY